MQRALVLVLFFLVLVPSPAAAERPGAPLGTLVEQILALFPTVAGDVIEVRGSAVTLSLGRRDGLQAGIELSLYREGRELRHPRTGQILGRTEEELGRVSVTRVFEAYSTGSVAEGVEVRPGDRARVSAGKIKLTLLALSEGVKDRQGEAVVRELTEELGRTGRFQVVMGDQIAVWLAERRIKTDDVLEGKGLEGALKRFGADYLLAVLLKQVQRKSYMEVRLFSSRATAPLLQTALFVPPSVKPEPRVQFSADQTRPGHGPKPRSFLARLLGWEIEAGAYSSGESSIPLREVARFGFPVFAMDVSVAPADRIPRVVLTDGQRIYLYRFANRVLEAEWTFGARGAGRILSVQLVDLDGDGMFEVVANRYDPQPQVGLTSFVLAAPGGKPQVVLQDYSQVLFAVDATGDGAKKTLWAQRYSRESFFTPGQVERVFLRNGTLISDGMVRVPHGFRATGATMSNIAGKEVRALAFVDEYNRLRIAVEGEETWRSSSPVGGGGHLKIEVIRQEERGSRSVFFNMEPTPLAVDLDGDGVEEILVPQNQVPGLLAVVFRGPAGYRFQSVNSGFEGIITALGAIRGEGTPTLVVAVVRFSGFFRVSGDTQIIVTEPE